MEENEINEQELENSAETEAALPKDVESVDPNQSAEAAEDLAAFQNAGMDSIVDTEVDEDEIVSDEFSFDESAHRDLFPQVDHTKSADPNRNIERLLDVEMNVTVQFGKTEVPLRDAVSFGIGSMIELNRSVDEPVELLVNNYPFARGEVVVIDGYYGVKITEIGSPEERSQTLLKNSSI